MTTKRQIDPKGIHSLNLGHLCPICPSGSDANYLYARPDGNKTKFRGHNKRLWMAAHLTRPARNDKMVELVERMLKLRGQTADSLRLTASGCEGNAAIDSLTP